MGLFSELKRRNVFRVAGVYAVVGWLLVQVAATVEQAIALPEWFDAVVLSFLVIGFPIILVFAWAFELTPEGIKRTSDVAVDDSITTKTGSKLDLLLVIALFVFAAAIIAPRFLPSGAPQFAEEEADTAPQSVITTEASGSAQTEVGTDSRASIAVLPFADLSPDGDQEYFADGVSEELLNVLAKVKGMRVAGRTSSFAFKGRNEDLREIGRVLGVDNILEGSVRTQGNRVRVTAQLIQVTDGFHLWSETYDGDLTDIFAVQDDIAEEILEALKTTLGVLDTASIATATRTDIEAYNLFLEARDLIYTRSKEKMERALQLLDEAITIDPNYAPAYAARAQTYVLLSDRPASYGDLPAREAFEQARKDIDRALEIDPELAHAHAVNGMLVSDLGRPDAAVASFRRALELNPNSLDARNWLALALSDDGQFHQAMRQLNKLLEVDPLYAPAVNNAVVYNEEVGDIDEARRISVGYLERVQDPAIRLRYESRMLNYDGKVAEAIKTVRAFPVLDRPSPVSSEYVFDWSVLGVDIVAKEDVPQIPLFQPVTTATLARVDEALAAARQQIEDNPNLSFAHSVYFQVLSIAREDKAVIRHYDTEFNGDIDEFTTRLKSSALSDPPPLMELALAFETSGREDEYRSAMSAWRNSIDTYRAGGSASVGRDLDDARYWSITGDADESIKFLEKAFADRGVLAVTAFRDRAFDNIEGDSRYLALRERNLERINEERAELRLDPLTDEFFQ
ncbi:MAG: tetratricopeptide repeat protein [Pseudomonadota bacterium]